MINGILTLITWVVLAFFAVFGLIKFTFFMDEHVMEMAKERGVPEDKAFRKRYNRTSLTVITIALAIWLIFTMIMFNSTSAIWYLIALALTAVALLVIYYNSWRAAHLQAVAWTFLSVPLGVAIGLQVFRTYQNAWGFFGALVAGLVVLFIITATTYVLYKFGSSSRERDDDEGEETEENEDDDEDVRDRVR